MYRQPPRSTLFPYPPLSRSPPRWKYTRRFDDEHPTPVLANIDDGQSKDVVLSNGWAQRPIPAEQLYDLLHDPNEAKNLVSEPALKSVLEDVRGQIGRAHV